MGRASPGLPPKLLAWRFPTSSPSQQPPQPPVQIVLRLLDADGLVGADAALELGLGHAAGRQECVPIVLRLWRSEKR